MPIRSLGLLPEPGMPLDGQGVAENSLGRLASCDPSWIREIWSQVIHALIASRLDYCSVLYVRLLWKMIWKFQPAQNAAAHALLDNPRFHGATLSIAGVTLASSGCLDPI